MGELKYMTGDLLELFKEGMFYGIAHGCNCQASMSGGIARQIAMEYPEAELVDFEIIKDLKIRLKYSFYLLGTYTEVYVKDQGYIFNLYTQDFPGEVFDKVEFQKSLYGALHSAIYKFKEPVTIAIPKIGAGIAGVDWNITEKTIKECIKDSLVDIVVVELPNTL
jgi:O-acetyl-ADP-ribose deacetylase (regulator of RNase III)